MKLRLSRSQKQHGMVNKKGVTFCLDARAELTNEEAANVKKYALGKEVIYNSANTRRHLDNAIEENSSGKIIGFIKGLMSFTMAKFSLSVTLDSLIRGHHIETTDLQEIVDTEDALEAACANIKTYLEAAATYEGGEQVIEI